MFVVGGTFRLLIKFVFVFKTVFVFIKFCLNILSINSKSTCQFAHDLISRRVCELEHILNTQTPLSVSVVFAVSFLTFLIMLMEEKRQLKEKINKSHRYVKGTTQSHNI